MVESENALRDNIRRKGENSYYYAHAPRPDEVPDHAIVLEGDGIITGGPPKLIARDQQFTPQPHIFNIRNYSWSDENDKVTIYIPFEEDVDPDLVTCKFDTKEVDLTYSFSDTETRKLWLKKLSNTISPTQSSYKVRKNKIVITLKKVGSLSWYKLAEN
ncbi:unnamed protein product [Blepharisma stoltei]|uniref:CS domain-containing protein n=1 Tax=Blepharisma stoltei TaxID=1481888 RepID=A0AAU9ITZ5_9CILI|nr:unnamed protein product [Blepharisma stoltei]